MDHKIAKQVVDFQRAAFESTFNAITTFQDQAEKTVNTFLETGIWPVPEEGKKVLNEWIQTYKKGREEFKRSVDDSFKKVESFFVSEKPST